MTTPASQVQLTIVEDVLGELILLDAPATQVVVGTDLSDTAPLPLGTAAAGTSVDGARADHVHAHGDQTGTTLHAAATTSAAGFMSGADKTKLDNATASGTANTLVLRDSSGDFAANVISADLIGNVTGDLTGTASAIADSIVTSAKILDETIVNADISPTAGIVVSKLAPGIDPRQLLQTNAAGDGVEWTDNVVVPGDLTVEGDLTVNGTETVINTQTLTVEDKNIELGKVASPTDTTADGGGITLKGATDKTINWVDATDSWTSSENVDLANGKSYKIDGADVLTSGSLGSTVTSSNLDTVGTLTSGAIGSGFTTVATAQGGTGQTSYANGELLIGKTDGTLAKATLSGGTGIDITNADGAVTVDVDSTVVTTAQTGTVTSTMIADGTIVDSDVNASAAIAGTKVSPDFGGQNVVTTGTSTAASLIPTGSTVPTNGVYLPAANSVAISTNGAGRLFIDSSGRLLVGTSSAANNIYIGNSANNPSVQLFGADNSTSAIAAVNTTQGASARLHLASGQPGANVANGNNVGFVVFSGFDGTDYRNTANISSSVDGTPGTADMPGRIVLRTTPSGSATPAERARLDSSGRLGLGTSSPNELLEVTGNIHMSGAADRTIFNRANNALSLGTNNTARLHITNAGNVGIGTTSPGSALEINAAAATSPFIAKINNAESARIDSSGRLLVGTSSDSGGALLQVNGNRIRIATANTPASASATGTTGEIAWDADYIYVCTATNTWKRTAISTW
jgi:hypothetical protein